MQHDMRQLDALMVKQDLTISYSKGIVEIIDFEGCVGELRKAIQFRLLCRAAHLEMVDENMALEV